ncbi:MAG TPA: amidohydrolase family protein [Xanthobacteraceae bacterium]|nr:amidohydrolase family protein [Xanthobacteraceae bacterium]
MAETNKYGPTAARKQAKPGRETRPKSTTIDIHSHVGVPAAAAIAQPHLDLSRIPLAHFATDNVKALNAKQEADRRSRMTGIENGLDERLKDMDEMGLDMQLVMPPPPQCYFTIPLEPAVKATRVLNDGIAAYVARKPDRFVALGTVPLQDGNEAAKELERSMKELGFKGCQVLTNVAGRELSDPAFGPFWKKAEELGALVVIHPNGFTGGERFSRLYFSNVIGNPLDTTVALHYLIFDGVLERHPNLKILAVHGGGYLGGYSGRIDHAWGARSDVANKLPKPPTEYLKKIYFDTVVFTPHQLEYLVKVFGADRVIMGTDYPFDMADYDPVGHVVETESLDAKSVAAICGGNAKKLLGL